MSRRSRRREAISPDLTPLIDMVFLLLVFFLVTSVFKKEELALLLKLPKAQEGKGSSDKKIEQLIIELSDDQVAINGQKTEIEQLVDWFKKAEKSTLVQLRVDGGVKYERLVRVLDLLQQEHLENVSLITERKTK